MAIREWVKQCLTKKAALEQAGKLEPKLEMGCAARNLHRMLATAQLLG
jgi:hypothetical protein